MGSLGKIALAVCGAMLIYGGMRLTGLAFRMWRLGLTARGIIAALLGAAYTLSPIDVIPDVIVGIGWVDDLIVLGFTALYISRLISQRQAGRRPGGRMRPPPPTVIPQLPPR